MQEDEKWYKEFLKGDDNAFDKIIKRYRDHLIDFLQSYTKDRDIAEDLSQDVFVYMIVNRKEYDFKYSFKTYLYTIARCRALNYINKSKREISFEEDTLDLVMSDFEIEHSIINEGNRKEVMKALNLLKEEYRMIIQLKYFEDFSYKEICKIMKKTMPQVKVLLFRAKVALKEKLSKEEYKC